MQRHISHAALAVVHKAITGRNSTVGICCSNSIGKNDRIPNGFSLTTTGSKTCVVHHALRQLMHRSCSGSVFTALSHMRTIERKFKAYVMVPLVVAKPWYTVPRMLQRHGRFTFASRWLSQRILACIYGTPMCQMPLLKQNVQSRCIICDVMQFSGIGGSGHIRTFFCLQMPLFRSSRIYRDTFKNRAFGSLDATASSSPSSSKPRHM
jgi:hypothetical protein